MKYKVILTLALSTFGLLSNTSVLAAGNANESAEVQDRWFEIEVILFNQNRNKNKNTEAFTPRDLTNKKRYALDLLSPHIQPDIATLKQLLPTCEEPEKQFPFSLEIAPIQLWPPEIQSSASLSTPANHNIDSNNEQNPTLVSNLNVKKPQNDVKNNASMSVIDSRVYVNSKNDQAEFKNNTPSSKTRGSQQVNGYFSNIEVPVYNEYPTASNKAFCVIPTKTLTQHLNTEQLEQFNPDSFPIEKMPRTVNGVEQWQDDENGEIIWASNKPYLISQDSLRLSSIVNRIKRSRDYSPLLHLGWRQVGEDKRNAQAVNIFAGDNLVLPYQLALSKQKVNNQTLELETILEKRAQVNTAQDKSSIQLTNGITQEVNAESQRGIEPSISEPATAIALNELMIDELSVAEELRSKAKQAKLQSLFQEFEMLGAEAPELDEKKIQAIVSQISTEIPSPLTLELNSSTALEEGASISKPIQPWSLDGLFKIHLDHYLFIDTEFNIVNQSKGDKTISNTDNARSINNQNNVITFKQDRRVISGEIHYFDHPNIGMIVQIRRFDPTKPADEAVSQSKK